MNNDLGDRDALRALLAEWASPPAELIDTLPKGGVQLRYLGHSVVTRALLECDPTWWWEPVAWDADQLPALDRDSNGHPVGLWIYLHVCGVRRIGYGSCDPGKPDAIKVLISDALKVTAMRFGVALSLWGKEHPEAGDAPNPHAPTMADEGNLPISGEGRYARLVEDHTADLVNEATAAFGVTRKSEITATVESDVRAFIATRMAAIAAEQGADADIPF